MPISVTIPTLGKPKNVKDAIISILSREWPLSARKVYIRVKNNGLSVSYQAVHKAIKEFVKNEILIKKDKEYTLNLRWLNSIKKFGEETIQDYISKDVSLKIPESISFYSKYLDNYKNQLKNFLKSQVKGLPILDCIELTLDEYRRRIKTDKKYKKRKVLKISRNEESFLLLGDSGSGKTTSLHQIALEYCKNGDRIPIIFNLTNFNPQQLSEIVRLKIFEQAGERINPKFIEDCLSKGIFVFLCDGLNEVCGQIIVNDEKIDKIELVIDRMNTFIFEKKYSKNKFIIACRNNSDPKEKLPIKSYKLEHFTEKQIENYLKKKRMSNLFIELKSSKKLFDLCTNPLILDMTIKVYSQQNRLPKNKTELYENYFYNLLYGWEKKIIKKPESFIVDIEQVLSKIASRMIPLGTIVPLDFFLKNLKKICKELEIERRDEKRLTDLIIKTNLIQIDGIDCKFSHHTFQEFLAAQELYDLFEEGNKIDEVFIKQISQKKNWLGSLIFLSGLLNNSTNLINSIKKYNLFFAGECIISAKKISYELRDKIIKELVQLVDHPNNNIHWGAADILHRMGKRACELILEEIENGKNKSLKRRLLWVGGRFDNPKVKQTLAKQLNESDEHTLIHVLLGLQDFKPTRTTPKLKRLFDDKSPIVRVESAEVFKIISPKNIKESESVQLNALDPLIPLLKHKEYWVRMHATLALGKITSKKSIFALIENLNDTNFSVQWHTILAIAKIGDEGIVSILNKKSEENPENKDLLEKAITAIKNGVKDRTDLIRSWNQ